jgi:hypothetical protein
MFLDEIIIHQDLDHPNVVRYLALVISPATGPLPPAPSPTRRGGAGPAFLLAYPPSRVGKGGQGG